MAEPRREDLIYDWNTVDAPAKPTHRATFDDESGGGPMLYVGGYFTAAGGTSANYIARWDGTAWSALGSGGNDFVGALAVLDDGAGGGQTA